MQYTYPFKNNQYKKYPRNYHPSVGPVSEQFPRYQKPFRQYYEPRINQNQKWHYPQIQMPTDMELTVRTRHASPSKTKTDAEIQKIKKEMIAVFKTQFEAIKDYKDKETDDEAIDGQITEYADNIATTFAQKETIINAYKKEVARLHKVIEDLKKNVESINTSFEEPIFE